MTTKKTKQFEYTINGDNVLITRCVVSSQTRKIEIPSSIEDKTIQTLDGSIFNDLSDNKRELIIPEGVKKIDNFKKILSKEWNKIVYPKSLEKIDINKDELLLKHGVIHIAPKGSCAEKCLKELLIDGRYKMIVEHEDIANSSERAEELRTFNYREPFDYEISKKTDNKLGAEYSINNDKTKDTIAVPAKVNGVPVHNFFFDRIPKNIKKIVLPETVKNIIGLTEHHFNAEGLNEIVISPDNTAYWTDGKAIFTKDKKKLIRFVSRGTKEYVVPDGTEIIGELAFARVNNLVSIKLPKSVKTIGDHAFYYCEKLKTIDGLDSVKNTGIDASIGCNLSKTVKKTGSNTASKSKKKGSSKVESKPRKIEPEDETIDMVIRGTTLVECKDTNHKVIKVPEGITKIKDRAFWFSFPEYSDDHLEKVILPSTLQIIGKDAFGNRVNLKDINLPKNLTSIGDGALSYCGKLKSIEIPPQVPEFNLFGLSCSSLTIPSSDIEILNKQRRISHDYNGIDYIKVASKNPNYKAIDGILYSKDGKTALYTPTEWNKKTLKIPDGVKEISQFFIKSNYYIETLIIPKTVELIDSEALCRLDELKEIVFEEGIALKEIKEDAFYETVVDEITIPEGVEIIGQRAFARLVFYNDSYETRRRSIKKIKLPKSIKKVGDGAFRGVKEVVLYDTYSPRAKDAYKGINKSKGKPNSNIGYFGIELTYKDHDAVENHKWNNFTVTVKSAETDRIKYKVYMGAKETDIKYQCILASGWGKNATFAFKEVDKYFSRLRDKDIKTKIAKNRLQYPIDLDFDNQKKYIDFLKKNYKKANTFLKKIKPIEK